MAADNLDDELTELELTNFAFGNYLGSGFYASDSGRLFVLQIPLSSELRKVTPERAGLILNYPVAIGLVDVDLESDVADPDDVLDLDRFAMASVIPGIEYVYPVNEIWYLMPFFDLGIAHDIDNKETARVAGLGLKSFITFDYGDSWLTIGNRLMHADQENLDSGTDTSFSSFETGLEYTFVTNHTIDGSALNFSLYYINYYYLDDLVVFESVDSQISLEDKNEVGFTFTLPKHTWLPDDARLGFGVQVTERDDLYRIFFGAPFF